MARRAIDSVKLVTGDTDRVSVGGGAHSGRAPWLGSIVMFNSSNQIIEKGLKIASHVLEAAVEDIAFAKGRFEVKGHRSRHRHLRGRARAALERTDLPEEWRRPLEGVSDETINLAAFPYGCHVCEVEIDPDTGETEIVRYTAVDDCGRAVNR
jgi:carbon-monoxide dehydrogenase large subunit